MQQPSAESQAGTLRAPVLLIVEDEFSVRWAAAEFLRESAYSVIEAANAAEAIAAIMSGAHIDLAFIDFKLPGGPNGIMLAKWLDAHRPAIPVLPYLGFDWSHCRGSTEATPAATYPSLIRFPISPCRSGTCCSPPVRPKQNANDHRSGAHLIPWLLDHGCPPPYAPNGQENLCAETRLAACICRVLRRTRRHVRKCRADTPGTRRRDAARRLRRRADPIMR